MIESNCMGCISMLINWLILIKGIVYVGDAKEEYPRNVSKAEQHGEKDELVEQRRQRRGYISIIAHIVVGSTSESIPEAG